MKANFLYRDKNNVLVSDKFVTDPVRVSGEDSILKATISSFQTDYVVAVSPTLFLAAAAVTDSSNNAANTAYWVPIALGDSAPPIVSGCFQVDQNGNGKVDGIRVDMSKSILDSSVAITGFWRQWRSC